MLETMSQSRWSINVRKKRHCYIEFEYDINRIGLTVPKLFVENPYTRIMMNS